MKTLINSHYHYEKESIIKNTLTAGANLKKHYYEVKKVSIAI